MWYTSIKCSGIILNFMTIWAKNHKDTFAAFKRLILNNIRRTIFCYPCNVQTFRTFELSTEKSFRESYYFMWISSISDGLSFVIILIDDAIQQICVTPAPSLANTVCDSVLIWLIFKVLHMKHIFIIL